MNTFYFIVFTLLLSIYLLFNLFQSFLVVILISFLLTISTLSMYLFLNKIIKNKFILAFICTVLLSLLFFFPIVYFFLTISDFIDYIDKDSLNKMVVIFKSWFYLIWDNLFFIDRHKIDLFNFDTQAIVSSILNYLTTAGSFGISFVKDIFLILLFYFITLIYGKDIFEFAKQLLPLSQIEILRIFSQVSNTMGTVFYSILTTAIFEGLLFGLFVGIYVDYDILLFSIIYGFASLIPVIGGLLVWLPVGLYELSLGRSTEAIVIVIYSIIMISIIADTFIKPLIIKYIDIHIVKSSTKINELLVFFSMIAGLSSFGFWGLIFGPAITSFFIAISKLYSQLYGQK
jgi:predicted PurR-regulated permease PerM